MRLSQLIAALQAEQVEGEDPEVLFAEDDGDGDFLWNRPIHVYHDGEDIVIEARYAFE